MGQSNPAQSLLDLYDKVSGKKKKDPPPKPVDTSWHDAEVRKANESFRKYDEQKRADAQKAQDQKKVSTQQAAKTPQKPTGRKPVTRKRISSK